MKLSKIILETNSTEADIVDDILSSLNENDTNNIISKMKTYARRGLLTLAIVTAVTQGMEARDMSSAEINRVNQVGTELVDKFEQSEDRMTVRAKKTLDELVEKKLLKKKDVKKLIKYAEDQDAYIGVATSPKRDISRQRAVTDAAIAAKIQGKTQPEVIDTIFRTSESGGRYLYTTVRIVKFN